MNKTQTIFISLLSLLCLTLNTTGAETLSFQTVLDQAIAHSYDLRIAETDIGISRTGILEARSEYFPQIRGRLNSEYQRDLTGGSSAVTTIGDTILPSGTQFQNSANLQATLTLFNFGIRRKRVKIAKDDVSAKSALYRQRLRDLKLQILEHYTNALQTYQTLQANQNNLPIRQSIYQMMERLNEAGEASKVLVAEEAIQVAKSLSEQNNLKAQFQKQLKDLSYYTQEAYELDILDMAPLTASVPSSAMEMVEENLPELAFYNLEINKKRNELAIKRRERLPQLTTYTYYNLFGADVDQWSRSVKALQNRSLSMGVSLNIPVFDGFKNRAQIKRAQLEIKRLKIEKDKKLAELRRDYEATHLIAVSYQEVLTHQAEATIQSAEKFMMEERLSLQALLDRVTVLKQQVAMNEDEQALKHAKAQKNSALIKLLIMTSTGD